MDLKSEVERLSKSLGMDIRFDSDADLVKLKKGAPLHFGELRALPDGAVVYVTYKEYGSRGYRINGAMRIQRSGDDWILEDGSSFAAEFSPRKGELEDTSPCVEDCCGEGEMKLFKVK